MKILFVLSQIEVTGAETYALTLASALRSLGHEIIFVSEKLRDTAGFKFHSVLLHSRNTSYVGRFQNLFALRKIIREEKIDLLHSHSRAANLVGFFSLLGLKSPISERIPMVVTVHGRWRNHFAARQLPCLGDRTVVVCPYLKRYLIEDLGIPSQQIFVVPNGIDAQKFAPAGKTPVSPNILYIGRFSGQKGNVIRLLLKRVYPEILKKFPSTRFKILGSVPVDPELDRLASQFNADFKSETVELVRTQVNLADLYRSSTVVIGSGRVALEAMACEKPVVAIGESSAPGLLTPENFDQAFDSNFGDCGEWNLFQKENPVTVDLEKILTLKSLADELSVWGRKMILDRFDAQKVAHQIEAIYKQ